MRLLLVALASMVVLSVQADAAFRLQQTIPLPNVKGRMDHLSIDVKKQRLFVAALGNDTVEVIALNAGKQMHTISGLAEPQGVLYLPAVNRLYVANGRDGSLRIYNGSSFNSLKSIQLGDDADNVRYDPGENLIYVGYGNGALAVLRTDGSSAGEIKLDSHPESFQLETNVGASLVGAPQGATTRVAPTTGSRIFVNLPKSRKIVVIDRKSRKVISTWQTDGASANYPMALDEANKRLFVVFRQPAELRVLDTSAGKLVTMLPSVGDSDDVFFDAKRRRIYAIGGEGKISVYEQQSPDKYVNVESIPTVPGARTGLFSADLDRLFVAVRQRGAEPAAIRVYKPE